MSGSRKSVLNFALKSVEIASLASYKNIQMKATEQCFPVMLFIVLPVEGSSNNESYYGALSYLQMKFNSLNSCFLEINEVRKQKRVQRTFQLLNSTRHNATVIFAEFSFHHHSKLAFTKNFAKCDTVTWYFTPWKRGFSWISSPFSSREWNVTMATISTKSHDSFVWDFWLASLK